MDRASEWIAPSKITSRTRPYYLYPSTMPPNRSRSSKESTEQEGRVLLAIQAIKNQQSLSKKEAARQFDIPYTTLHRRLTGQPNRSTTRANNHKLSIIEEQSLLKWIISMDLRGVPPRYPQVREMADILLAERGSIPIQTVGDKWVYNFVKRHQEIKPRFTRRYEYRRAQNEDPKTIREWFETVQKTILQYGIHPETRMQISSIYPFGWGFDSFI